MLDITQYEHTKKLLRPNVDPLVSLKVIEYMNQSEVSAEGDGQGFGFYYGKNNGDSDGRRLIVPLPNSYGRSELYFSDRTEVFAPYNHFATRQLLSEME